MKSKPKFRVGQVICLQGGDRDDLSYCKVLQVRRDTFFWAYSVSEWAGWQPEKHLRPLTQRESGFRAGK